MAQILVIDGQGGRMGATFIERLKKKNGNSDIIAVGTNSMATEAMLKAGANHAATGENPVVVNSKKADYIVGPIGIIAADSLYGEITSKMSVAVAKSSARKLLIPVNTCGIYVAGISDKSLNELIDDVIDKMEL